MIQYKRVSEKTDSAKKNPGTFIRHFSCLCVCQQLFTMKMFGIFMKLLYKQK